MSLNLNEEDLVGFLFMIPLIFHLLAFGLFGEDYVNIFNFISGILFSILIGIGFFIGLVFVVGD